MHPNQYVYCHHFYATSLLKNKYDHTKHTCSKVYEYFNFTNTINSKCSIMPHINDAGRVNEIKRIKRISEIVMT